MSLETVVANLVNQMENRFFGKYRGFVVDNEDKENLGRLKLKVPSVLGNDVVTGWAMPCITYGGAANQGFLCIPEREAGVWVEFEEGDLEFPIWVGTFWSKPGGESELPKPNGADGAEEGAVQSPPTRKILKTKKGHSLQFEDADDKEMITLYEGKNKHVITLDKNGIHITHGSKGHKIVMDDAGVKITDKPGNEIILNSDGIICKDKNNNQITMDAMSGFPAGAGIKVNGEKRLCTEDLINWLLSHQHVGNMGAPTPLFPASMTDLIAATAGGNTMLTKKMKAG